MPLSPGARLGPYEVLDSIGAGGMGEVYRARDTRLNRTVAIKIAVAQFSERFESEARAVAALNHPHICTLFDVGPDYLVMEYMSPEQLQGKEVDARTDLFSFGAVLYELVTGRRAFESPDSASLIASVLTFEPPPLAV